MPVNTKLVQCRIPDDDYRRLKELSAEEGISTADIVRRMILRLTRSTQTAPSGAESTNRKA